MIEQGYLSRLVACLEEGQTVSLEALELIYELSLHQPNVERIVSTEGLVENVKKLTSRGRLKQKKVALATFKILQEHIAKEEVQPCRPSLAEITNQTYSIVNPPRSSLLVGKRGTRQKATFSSPRNSASTYTIFVEKMNSDEKKSLVEKSLLETKGVISFFFGYF